MQTAVTLPTQEFVWVYVLAQVKARLEAKAIELYHGSGMAEEYGRSIACESELRELVDEIIGIIMRAIGHDMEKQEAGAIKSVGRPRDVLRHEIGKGLFTVYCRFNDKAARQSVWTSIDGQLVQEEAGKYFEFFEAVMDCLNEVLVNDLSRKPISAAWLARSALEAARSPASRLTDFRGI